MRTPVRQTDRRGGGYRVTSDAAIEVRDLVKEFERGAATE
jgi:hypothetical protein